MSNESLMLGSGNWAAKTNNLLGYVVGDISAQFTPREFTFSRGSTATFTNPAGVIQSSASGIARVENNALLLEPQRTNLALYSEQFENASWGKNGSSITANSTNAPNSTLTADSLIEDTTTGLHFISATIAVNTNTTYTGTIYVKANTRTKGRFRLNDTGGQPATDGNFDLSAETISAGTITNVGGGWFRLSLSRLMGSTSGTIVLFLGDNSGSISYTGNGTNGLYIWGCQLEVGAYPTTYIPTTNATATRLADSCSKTGISSLIGQTQGTIYLDTKYSSLGSTSSGRWFKVFGTSNEIALAINGVNAIRSIINNQSDTITTAPRTDTGVKIAWAYNASGVVLFVNGVQYALPNGGAEVMSSLDSILFDASVNAFFAEGTISQAALFTTRLSNAELASLTTL